MRANRRDHWSTLSTGKRSLTEARLSCGPRFSQVLVAFTIEWDNEFEKMPP
ncbi:hypothetical protein ACPOL_0048 [Acidisarcina polymorpha]|uniref:Uncharacterized protein n=1 Tax=Acidisarcina polymorpha TaxID=2211140 RepID=A0A2Z5FSI4_9BACT|nr:hypothetical protein ACPOL_0048 [Acidisarcina polymorpha]